MFVQYYLYSSHKTPHYLLRITRIQGQLPLQPEQYFCVVVILQGAHIVLFLFYSARYCTSSSSPKLREESTT